MSRPTTQTACLDALAASALNSDPDIATVCSAFARIHSDFTRRLHADSDWCEAFAAAASSSSTAKRVLVVGLGSGIPALAAAKAGCHVLWAQRLPLSARHLQAVPERLAKANGVEDKIQSTSVRQWSELSRLAAHADDPFDLIITEEIGDDPLADGLLRIAQLAHTSGLLRPSTGLFAEGDIALVLVVDVVGADDADEDVHEEQDHHQDEEEEEEHR